MSNRPWFSDQAAPAIKRKPLTKLELDNMNDSLDAAIDLNWRQAAYEAMERIVKNHYCPVMPAAARRHGQRSKMLYGGINETTAS